MKGGTSTIRPDAGRLRPAPLRRKAAAIGVAGAVAGLMGAASAFQSEPQIAEVALIAPSTLERDGSPSPDTAPLVDVLGGTLTAEDALASCRATLVELARVVDVTVPANPATAAGDAGTVKEQEQACAAVLDQVRSALEDAAALRTGG